MQARLLFASLATLHNIDFRRFGKRAAGEAKTPIFVPSCQGRTEKISRAFT